MLWSFAFESGLGSGYLPFELEWLTLRFCSRLSSMLTVRPRVSDPSSGSNTKGLSILSRFGWRLPDDSMGIFASSPPGEVTPHSARKVQKMPANGISSELRAHQIAPMSEVPGRPRTKNPRRSLMKFWTFAEFHDSARAHLPVLSRRLFGVCKRHLVYYFSFWYWYCGVRLMGCEALVLLRHSQRSTSPSSSSLRSTSSAPALRAQTRPAMEFGSGEEGLRPDLLSPFSFLSSCSSSMTVKGLGVFLWFQPLLLSLFLFVR